MPSVQSGVPLEQGAGQYIGASDLREFSADIGLSRLPDALYVSGPLGTHGIFDEGGTEGLIFRNDKNGAFFIAFRNYTSLYIYGETLIRVFLEGGNQFEIAGGGGVIQTIGQGVYNASSASKNGNYSGICDVGAQSFYGTAGAASGVVLDDYIWIRCRCDDQGGGDVRFRLQVGLGDADTPPSLGSWAIDETLTQDVAWLDEADESLLGWIRRTTGPASNNLRKFSWFGFTTDPDNYPTPVPSDIIDQGSGIPLDFSIDKPVLSVDAETNTTVDVSGSVYNESDAGPSIPSEFAQDSCLAAWAVQDWDVNQPSYLRDLTGNGRHMFFGIRGTRKTVVDVCPNQKHDNRVAVVGSGAHTNENALGLDNTGQAYNLPGQVIRWTVKASMNLNNGTQVMVGHGPDATHKSWYITMTTDGRPGLIYSVDGTAESVMISTIGFSGDYEVFLLRVTLDLSTGDVIFEKSVDGTVWLPLTTQTGGITGSSLFQPDAADPVEFCSRYEGAQDYLMGGGVYTVEVEAGIGTPQWQWSALSDGLSSMIPLGTQTNTESDWPALTTGFIRFTRNTNQASTYVATSNRLSEFFDFLPGDDYTILIVVAQDDIEGNGSGNHTPISKSNSGNVNEEGWEFENDAAVAGFSLEVSNGGGDDQVGPADFINDSEKGALLGYFDSGGAEMGIQRIDTGAPFTELTDTYDDRGSYTGNLPVFLGRSGFNNRGASMDFYGAAIWKGLLTDQEKIDAAAYLGVVFTP